MPTFETVVGRVRTLLSGSLGTEVALLAEPYRAGDERLSFKNSRRVAPGMTLSAGLTSFLTVDSDQSNVTVVAGIDGSPVVDLPVNTPVWLRPRHTTWAIFQEITSTVSELSSSTNGLYRLVVEEHLPDVVDNTYLLGGAPLKVLRVRYTNPGEPDQWRFANFTLHPTDVDGPVVEAWGIPSGGLVQIDYAAQFTVPDELSDTLAECFIPDSYQRLLAVGAARNLSLSSESRRVQPFSQGDPRRAEEVPSTGNVVVFDRLVRDFKALVADERARLIQQTPYRFKMEAHA